MDTKSLQKYIGLIILGLGLVVFFIVIYAIVKQPIEDYQAETSRTKESTRNLEQVKKEEKNASLQEAEELEQLKKLKEIYKSDVNASADSTGVYGTMFDEIINYAKQNSLMIRSIEYDMNPTYDPIYASHSDMYNVCEFKFYFVGTYNQFKSFLADIVKYKYFLAISRLSITAFPENTDYLLINVSFTLYSEQNKAQQSAFKNRRSGRGGRRPAPGASPEQAPAG